MRTIAFSILLILSFSIYAQEKDYMPKVFVRVFDLNGKKIFKGKINAINDTLLHIRNRKNTVKIPVEIIGSIKTKRSGGNNVGIGAAIGAGALSTFMLAYATPGGDWIFPSYEEAAFKGPIIGAIFGAPIGAITIIFKKSKTYRIDGDKTNLVEFKESVMGLKQQ